MPDMSEASVYKALGLSVPEAQGENVQEPAEPAQTQPAGEEPTPGEQAQEPAEPAEGGDNAQGEDEVVEEPTQEPEEPAAEGRKELTVEERRANAARRRQQEQQAAIDTAVANARREEQERSAAALTALFTQAGMKNTFTGELITTMEQFTAWQKQFRDAQLQQELSEGKLTVDRLNELVADNPIVKQAQQVLQQSGPAQTPQQDAAQQAADNARIQQEIAEIGRLDPSVKNLGDILNGPKGKEFYEYVNKGYSFLDSYRLSNFERLTTAKAQAARQQAVMNDRGKDHMRGTNGIRGTGALSVPNADMAMFRAFNPNATEAEIQAYYNKYMKGR